MPRNVDVKGGNCDVIFDTENNIAKKYLRNTSSPERIDRFRKELDVFQEICKNPIPNVVQVLDVYIDTKNLSNSFIAMKKYEGSLYEILHITKGNAKMALKMILPIIKALQILANKPTPIYHRDIKPDNILFLEKDGEYILYLADFGACFLKDENSRITPESIAVGPRMFIAPEYEKGRVEDVTEKGDIFSIGKVIWCMINGEENDLLPSNFWFVEEYDLSKRFPDDSDMIGANTIIASCLNINPEERCNYATLIEQIEKFIDKNALTIQEENQYKVRQYQEKRRLELMEIQQKNKLLVNYFSICYVNALKELNKIYSDFELLQKLYEDYRKKSKDGIDYTTVNVENNSAHYLYSTTYDRVYISINYKPARRNERYCHITFEYNIATRTSPKGITICFGPQGEMLCKYDNFVEQLSEEILMRCLDRFIMDYIEA